VIEEEEFGISSIGVSTPLPGSAMFADPDKFGIHIEINDWRRYDLFTPTFKTEILSRNDIRSILYLTIPKSMTAFKEEVKKLTEYSDSISIENTVKALISEINNE